MATKTGGEIGNGKAYTVMGRIIHIGAVETFGTFQKRPFVLKIGGEGDKYPQEVPFELAGEKNVGKLDGFAVEDQIAVTFDLSGRAGKKPDRNGNPCWFGSLSVWKIEPAGATVQRPAGGEQADDGAAGADGIPF
jgi:hypothetical protein